MLRHLIPSFVVAALGVQPLFAKALPPPTLLTPSGKWAVEYAKDMCALNRSFGTGADQMVLAIKPAPNSDQARIMVLRKAPEDQIRRGTADVKFSDGSAPAYAMASSGWANGMSLTAIDLPRSSLKPLMEGGTISIRFGRGLNHVFAPTGMAAAMAALGKCERDLLKGWGMSEAAQDAIVQLPTIKYQGLFNSNDYPTKLVDAGVQGSVGALLSVDANGSVSDCRVIEKSRSEVLDKATCSIFEKRAHYRPAIDKSGKPVPALTYFRVNWMIDTGGVPDSVTKSAPPPPPMVPNG